MHVALIGFAVISSKLSIWNPILYINSLAASDIYKLTQLRSPLI